MRKYEFVERLKAAYPVTRLCRALGVSPSGYWAWRRRVPQGARSPTLHLQQRIVAIHAASRATYGAPRIHAELRPQGVRCSRKRVARLMRLAGVSGCHRRRFQTTRRDPARPSAPDLVQRAFSASAPNQVWVADLTYVPTRRAFSSSRSSSTPIVAASSAGPWRRICAPNSSWRPWRWRCSIAVRRQG